MAARAENLSLAFKGFQTRFTDALMEAPANTDKMAMTVPSVSKDETCGWLGQLRAQV